MDVVWGKCLDSLRAIFSSIKGRLNKRLPQSDTLCRWGTLSALFGFSLLTCNSCTSQASSPPSKIPALAARYEYSEVKHVTKHLAWPLSSHIRPPHTMTSVRQRQRFGHIFDIQLWPWHVAALSCERPASNDNTNGFFFWGGLPPCDVCTRNLALISGSVTHLRLGSQPATSFRAEQRLFIYHVPIKGYQWNTKFVNV